MPATAQRRSEKLDLRITPAAKARLQAAAVESEKSLSDFVLESALDQAEQTLQDRRSFLMDARSWKAMQEALDAPPRDLPGMRKLLSRPGFFDKPGKRS
jgi:uncharacterized protein (DUF1778 family)